MQMLAIHNIIINFVTLISLISMHIDLSLGMQPMKLFIVYMYQIINTHEYIC